MACGSCGGARNRRPNIPGIVRPLTPAEERAIERHRQKNEGDAHGSLRLPRR